MPAGAGIANFFQRLGTDALDIAREASCSPTMTRALIAIIYIKKSRDV
jgi:hypothetical protein